GQHYFVLDLDAPELLPHPPQELLRLRLRVLFSSADDVDLVKVVNVDSEATHPLRRVDARGVHPHGPAPALPVDHAPELRRAGNAKEVVFELCQGGWIGNVSVENEVRDADFL